jgi:hypothetical protein
MMAPGTPDRPVWVRIQDAPPGARTIAIGLAAAILTAFLASRAERAGAGIDTVTAARMRLARLGQHAGDVLTTAGLRLTAASTRAYDAARM